MCVCAAVCRRRFTIDFLATVPVDRVLAAAALPSPIPEVAQLLTLLRVARVVRTMSVLNGANALRIVQLMLYFVMVGHWLGA